MPCAAAGLVLVSAVGVAASSGLAQATATSVGAPTATTSARLPTLELVGEYGCPAPCLPPETFGTGAPVRAVAAGTGNSFAVLQGSTGKPYRVWVWNLDTNTSRSFVVTEPGPGQVSRPSGIMLLGDTVVVAGNTFTNQRIEAFSFSGAHLFSLPVPATEGYAALTTYVPSPSGNWIVQRRTEAGTGMGYPILRSNRATSEMETLDVPASLLAGSEATNPLTVQSSTSLAVSDDGTMVMGRGDVGYRLVLIPADASARIEGGRTIAKRPLSQEQINSIRNPVPRTLPADTPPEMRARLEALPPPDPNRAIPDGVPHFGRDALAFDATGRLWVKTTRGNFDETTVFDVFDSKLNYLGETKVDGGVVGDLFHVGRQLLVARMYGAKGVTVKVWRIREP
jgi:hypothetical protein